MGTAVNQMPPDLLAVLKARKRALEYREEFFNSPRARRRRLFRDIWELVDSRTFAQWLPSEAADILRFGACQKRTVDPKRKARLDAIYAMFPQEEYAPEAHVYGTAPPEADELRARMAELSRNDSGTTDRLFTLAYSATRIVSKENSDNGKDHGANFDDMLAFATDVVTNEKMTHSDGRPLSDSLVIRDVCRRLRRFSGKWRKQSSYSQVVEVGGLRDLDVVGVNASLNAIETWGYADGKDIEPMKLLPVLTKLTETERRVLGGLYKGWTQKEVAKAVGISQPRVTQIIAKARKIALGR